MENCRSAQEQNPTPVFRDEEEEEGGIWALKPDPEPIGARMQGRRGPGVGNLTFSSAESPAREPIGRWVSRASSSARAGGKLTDRWDTGAWLELEVWKGQWRRKKTRKMRPGLASWSPCKGSLLLGAHIDGVWEACEHV